MLISSQQSAQSVALYTRRTGEIMILKSYSPKSSEVLPSIAPVSTEAENWPPSFGRAKSDGRLRVPWLRTSSFGKEHDLPVKGSKQHAERWREPRQMENSGPTTNPAH